MILELPSSFFCAEKLLLKLANLSLDVGDCSRDLLFEALVLVGRQSLAVFAIMLIPKLVHSQLASAQRRLLNLRPC